MAKRDEVLSLFTAYRSGGNSKNSQALLDLVLSDLASIDVSTMPSVDDQICAEIRNGNMLNAIKLHRVRTGDSLKDSKDYVERIQKEMYHLGPR